MFRFEWLRFVFARVYNSVWVNHVAFDLQMELITGDYDERDVRSLFKNADTTKTSSSDCR